MAGGTREDHLVGRHTSPNTMTPCVACWDHLVGKCTPPDAMAPWGSEDINCQGGGRHPAHGFDLKNVFSPPLPMIVTVRSNNGPSGDGPHPGASENLQWFSYVRRPLTQVRGGAAVELTHDAALGYS